MHSPFFRSGPICALEVADQTPIEIDGLDHGGVAKPNPPPRNPASKKDHITRSEIIDSIVHGFGEGGFGIEEPQSDDSGKLLRPCPKISSRLAVQVQPKGCGDRLLHIVDKPGAVQAHSADAVEEVINIR